MSSISKNGLYASFYPGGDTMHLGVTSSLNKQAPDYRDDVEGGFMWGFDVMSDGRIIYMDAEIADWRERNRDGWRKDQDYVLRYISKKTGWDYETLADLAGMVTEADKDIPAVWDRAA